MIQIKLCGDGMNFIFTRVELFFGMHVHYLPHLGKGRFS